MIERVSLDGRLSIKGGLPTLATLGVMDRPCSLERLQISRDDIPCDDLARIIDQQAGGLLRGER